MAEFIKDYEYKAFLGSGSYSRVYEVEKGGKTYALKRQRFLFAGKENEGIQPANLLEADTLIRVRHPYLLNAVDIFADKEKIYFVLEKADYSLQSFISSKTAESSGSLIIYWAFQILCGLSYLHKHRFIHSDLKPDNILIYKDGTLKISDYGLTKRNLGQKKTYNVQSLFWKSPEVLLREPFYSTAIDIWSFGVILFELIFRKYPFPVEKVTNLDQTLSIFNVLGWPTPDSKLGSRLKLVADLKTVTDRNEKGKGYLGSVTKEEWKAGEKLLGKNFNAVISIINTCFTYEEEKRPTAEELLANPIFKEYSCPKGSYKEGRFKFKVLGSKVRKPLFEFLEKLRAGLNFSYITLLLTEDMLERLHALMTIPKDQLQVFALACFSLSSKLVESDYHAVSSYEKICGESCKTEDIIKLEIFIFEKLGFLLYVDNLITYCKKQDPSLTYQYVTKVRNEHQLSKLRRRIRKHTFDCDEIVKGLTPELGKLKISEEKEEKKKD